MSYDVNICLPEVPADDPAAWQVLECQQGEQGPTPDVFKTLHDRLTARFPCICDLPDDEVDEVGVWSDGPLLGNFGHKVATLGMVSEHVGDVLPFLIQSSNNLGLVVFDRQTNLIHRPGTAKSGKPKPWWKFWK